MVMSSTCYRPNHFPYAYDQFRANDIEAVGTYINVFGYDENLCATCRGLIKETNLFIDNRGEVLNVIGKVHRISEGGLDMVHNHFRLALVSKSNQELYNLASG